MSHPELRRPRDVGGLFGESLRVFGSHPWLFVALSAAVVVPVGLVVEGIGLERLTSPYDPSPPLAETLVPTAVQYLVMAPIVTAICIYALHRIADGERPPAGQVFVAGFEAFTPLFGAVALAALGIAVGGILIVPGLYLLVRWFFVPQAVVIEGARGPAALTRSGQLVEGLWWRTAGLLALAILATAVAGLVITAPFAALAESTDRDVWALVGSMVSASVTTPFVALYSTLLYYDTLARKARAAS